MGRWELFAGFGGDISVGDVGGKVHIVKYVQDPVKSVGGCMAFVRQDL